MKQQERPCEVPSGNKHHHQPPSHPNNTHPSYPPRHSGTVTVRGDAVLYTFCRSAVLYTFCRSAVSAVLYTFCRSDCDTDALAFRRVFAARSQNEAHRPSKIVQKCSQVTNQQQSTMADAHHPSSGTSELGDVRARGLQSSGTSARLQESVKRNGVAGVELQSSGTSG